MADTVTVEARVLQDSDLTSATWARIKAHLEKRIDALRKKNDENLDDKSTARLRGEIAEAKRILKLGDKPQQIESSGTSNY